MATLAFEAVPYDRTLHEGFVRSSWCKGAREPWETLAAYLRRPSTRCLVAHHPASSDDLLGWAAVDTYGSVIFAYTRNLYGKLRCRGLATSLLERLDVDLSQPTPLLFWTPSAAAIARKGDYRIYFNPLGKAAA